MIKVKVRPNEDVRTAYRRFKKICDKEGLNKAIKRNSFYEKPSERRRRKRLKSLQQRRRQSQSDSVS